MNFNDLKIFIAAAEHGNFTQAAAITNTVQSNVSARIKTLEIEIGRKLFDRSTRSAELTPAGTKFLKTAREIVALIDEFKSSDNQTALNGLIKIGCLQTTAALRAPTIFRNFNREYPDVDFKLKTGTTAHLIKEVLDYKVDGAFVAGKVSHPDLQMLTVIDEELIIIYSSSYSSLEKAVSNSKTVKIVVFNKGCSYRALLMEIMKKMNIDNIKIIEMDTLEGIINTVEMGTGITLLPAELITKLYSYRNLKICTSARFIKKVPTVFIKRKDFPMTKIYSLFFDSIIKGYITK